VRVLVLHTVNFSLHTLHTMVFWILGGNLRFCLFSSVSLLRVSLIFSLVSLLLCELLCFAAQEREQYLLLRLE